MAKNEVFNDYREPIEYVVDQYFKRQRLYEANMSAEGGTGRLTGGCYDDDSLPETPCRLIKDENGRLICIIYGDVDALEADEEGEGDIIIRREELNYNENGKLQSITTTYPDGATADTTLIYENGKVIAIE